MRVPLPTNKLVAFTLAGALMTALVAGALAFPGLGLGQSNNPLEDVAGSSQQLAEDAPTPNPDFTPAVQTQSNREEHEDEYEEEHEDEYEEEHEDEADEEDHEVQADDEEAGGR